MAYTTIDKPDDYFNTVLYTGNGATQSITGVGFQPDWVWIKTRSSTYPNVVTDAVRGATNNLYTNLTDAEDSSANYLTSFDSDGFSVGSYAGVNLNSATMVAWSWLGANSTASNTDGSITSTVSANTTAGFSIVGYTGNGTAGATIGHGLGATPSMIIIKNRIDSVSSFWCVYHKSSFVSQADPGVLYLNDAGARSADTNVFGNTTVTINSDVFSLGNYNGSNGSGDTQIAYCFADVKGFSKFGSYTGNGSTDGTFVYTGFKPAFVMMKRTDTSSTNWTIIDNKRNTFNPETQWLYANANDAEVNPGAPSDFLSNGFKQRSDGSYVNASGGTYIYMAFAENPFVTSTSIPTTAR
jgi:hypothetical protein